MIYIAHRGNLNGSIPNRENKIEYISEALAFGYNVEVDVRYINNKFVLGHDFAINEIVPDKWLREPLFHKIWFHAKSIFSLKKSICLNFLSSKLLILKFKLNILVNLAFSPKVL